MRAPNSSRSSLQFADSPCALSLKKYVGRCGGSEENGSGEGIPVSEGKDGGGCETMMGRIRLTRLILISFFSLLVIQILIVGIFGKFSALEFRQREKESGTIFFTPSTSPCAIRFLTSEALTGKGRRSPWIIF